jgi:hypothetical protein
MGKRVETEEARAGTWRFTVLRNLLMGGFRERMFR